MNLNTRTNRREARVLAALQQMVAEGECYCADNVAARGPCGHCVAREAIAEAVCDTVLNPEDEIVAAEEVIEDAEDHAPSCDLAAAIKRFTCRAHKPVQAQTHIAEWLRGWLAFAAEPTGETCGIRHTSPASAEKCCNGKNKKRKLESEPYWVVEECPLELAGGADDPSPSNAEEHRRPAMKTELKQMIANHGVANLLREVAVLVREQADDVIEDAEDHDPSCELEAAMKEIADCLDENADDLEDAGIEYDRATDTTTTEGQARFIRDRS